jgi:glycosyltransferase involved in cell wall biosynthesis
METLRRISVIIPTHNRQESLVKCLRSLSDQSYPKDRFEVIVVDDGSSLPIRMDSLPYYDPLRMRTVRLEGRGAATARNAGADESRGEYLAFTDDDCILHPSWLSELARVCEKFPDAAVTGRTINQLMDNRYASAAQLLVEYLYAYYNAIPHRARFLTSNNFAIPTAAFRELGGFSTEFASAGGEDREFCDRWLAHNFQLIYAPEAIAFHAHSMTLSGFVRQQFNYGKGAFHYYRLRSMRNGSDFSIEPPAFYFRMFRYPYQRQKALKANILASLFALSQGANFAGFAFENFSYRFNHRD